MTGSSSRPSPFQWPRGPRSSFSLGRETGVYALFLRSGSRLPGVQPGEEGLLYIGRATSAAGLEGRCHFCGNTAGHSPRRSLAALLIKQLDLVPVFVPKKKSDTWRLESKSEATLNKWMHNNLDLAIEICSDPIDREAQLVGSLAPPLNLKQCGQSPQHCMISRARENVLAEVRRAFSGAKRDELLRHTSRHMPSRSSKQRNRDCSPADILLAGPDAATMDTAEAIAAYYALNPKSFRQRLRDSINWYRKPQNWTFPSGSKEWQDMITVAEEMTKRRC